MRQKFKIEFIPWRFYFIGAIIFLAVAGLIVRMVDLSVFERNFLETQGNARSLRVISEPAFRGMITDRNGYPLAISTSVYSVWANPKEMIADKKSLRALSRILGLDTKTLQTQIEHYKEKNREFVYLKRDLPPEIVNQVKALSISGIYLEPDYKRFYPEGEIASHVIGFTNVDDKGQEGLELAYNDWLSGVPGKKLVVKDRLGRVISDVQNIEKQQPGHDLALSVDYHLQYLAYRELMEGVQKNLAKSGTAIVMDVKTGEILAMVNYPSFNPNKITPQEKNYMRNSAVTDIFEPGSTIKTFSVAAALASGKYKPDTVINTHPGWMRIEHYVVHDEHNNGPLTVTQILQLSSNVGISKIMLSLPSNQLAAFLHRMGFGEITGVGFPGEQAGRLPKRPIWRPSALAHLAFGYGISATALQLAHAYATLANDGIAIPVTLIHSGQQPEGERVISSKLSRQMLVVLESVLAKGGTGSPARVPGFHVAGKTGTAWIASGGGYEKKHYNSTFIGIAPVSNPRLVVAVVLHDPKGKEFLGGYVSGPVFEKIMEEALRDLNVAPDDPESLPK